MGQEFIIKSQALEDKVNQLLPSQGGFQAGVDLSASTTVIPIVDLTESAEGSGLRQDLQRSYSLIATSAFDVNNTTTTVINTTGYFNIRGTYNGRSSSSLQVCKVNITDGVTTKVLNSFVAGASSINEYLFKEFNLDVFLQAGDSVTITSPSTIFSITGISRQIADISGNLINP